MIQCILRKKAAVLAFFIVTMVGSSLYAQVLDMPVAVVRLTETVNIGQRELRRQVQILEQQLQQTLSLEDRKEVLDAQVGEVLILQAAARDNIRVSQTEIDQAIAQQREQLGSPSEAQFRTQIESQTGMTWQQYQDQIRKRLIQEKYIVEKKGAMIRNVPQPSEAEIRDTYEENATQFANPAMIRFTHIFFDTRGASSERRAEARRQIDDMNRRITSGRDTFQELVNRAVDDPKYSAGDFGYLPRGEQQVINALGRSFVDSVFRLEVDETSGIIESNYGYHIVRITDRRSPKLLGLEDPLLPGQNVTVRDQIRSALFNRSQQEALQRAVREVVDDLKRQAEITLYEQNLRW